MIHRVFHRLILASQSSARAALLKTLEIEFDSIPAYLDESLIKRDCQEQGRSATEAALELAIAKAQAVARLLPPTTDALIIGADQILCCEGRWFDKASSLKEAQEHLSFLQGKDHLLSCTACIVYHGKVIWQHVAIPCLTMRAMEPDEIAAYLREGGDDILSSVGCYKIEQGDSFSKVEGDRDTIIGLPLKEMALFLESLGIKCADPNNCYSMIEEK